MKKNIITSLIVITILILIIIIVCFTNRKKEENEGLTTVKLADAPPSYIPYFHKKIDKNVKVR